MNKKKNFKIDEENSLLPSPFFLLKKSKLQNLLNTSLNLGYSFFYFIYFIKNNFKFSNKII